GFAHLGAVYARDVMGRPSPGVGLLNVGEEDEKGNAVVKEAHQLLKQTPGIRYVGNVEGRDILAGRGKGGEIDVVVCDGFVGNAILKFYESAGRMFAGMLQQAVPDGLGRPEVKQLFKFLDYSEYGGAPPAGCEGRRHHLPRGLPGPRDHERGARGRPDGHQSSRSGHRRGIRGRRRRPVKRPIAELWGTGSYTPKRVLTNDEFSKILDTSDQWIRERTGIRERRVAGPAESNACMAKAAAERVLEETALTAADLDAVVVA